MLRFGRVAFITERFKRYFCNRVEVKANNMEHIVGTSTEVESKSAGMNPFEGMKIASHEPLLNLTRQVCDGCNQKRKYFCYKCYKIMGDASKIPSLKLPLQVDMYLLICDSHLMRVCRVHHPKELRSKSTAMHARVLAPNEVSIYDAPGAHLLKSPS